MHPELLAELKALYARQYVAQSDFEAVLAKYPQVSLVDMKAELAARSKLWPVRTKKRAMRKLQKELGELYPYLFERERLNAEFIRREQEKPYMVEGNRLDAGQIAAVVACEDAELILAPAGSGKSASLLAKLNYLTGNLGILAERILVIAFTNKVVAELKERIKMSGVEIRTFHSLGNKIFQSRYQGFTLISEAETASFFRKTVLSLCKKDPMYKEFLLDYVRETSGVKRNESGIFENSPDGVSLSMALGDLVNFFISTLGLQKSERINLVDLKARLERIPGPTERAHALKFYDLYSPVAAAYEKFLKENKSYDFADMLNLATAYVETLPPGSFQYDYILVDEAQDLSTSKYLLLKAILKKSGRAKLFAVGDDWQSIYRFAGSNLRVLDDFEQIFERETYRGLIELTYRFGQPTARLSNKFIQKNPHQSKKQVVPGVERTTTIEVAISGRGGAGLATASSSGLGSGSVSGSVSGLGLASGAGSASNSDLVSNSASNSGLASGLTSVSNFGSVSASFLEPPVAFSILPPEKTTLDATFNSFSHVATSPVSARLSSDLKSLDDATSQVPAPPDYQVVDRKLKELYLEYGEKLFEKSIQIISRYNNDVYRLVNRETLEYENVWLELADPNDVGAGAVLHWWVEVQNPVGGNKDLFSVPSANLDRASGGVARRELLIPFCSMHKAKGITRDIVFVLNMNQGGHGMPALRPDDPILSTMLAEIDPYPLAEERRLFYVAVTRAKERTILVAEVKRISDYVFEIQPDFSKSGFTVCPKCRHGVMLSRKRPDGKGSQVCSNKRCRHTQ